MAFSLTGSLLEEMHMQNEPYFYNLGVTPEQLEDWLGQQKLHLSHYNRLISERAALIKRLTEVDND